MSPHHVYPENHPPLPESAALAIRRLGAYQHVGVADLYALSWCLLLLKLGEPLDEMCFDDKVESGLVRVEHHDAARNGTGAFADEGTARMVDDLTAFDRQARGRVRVNPPPLPPSTTHHPLSISSHSGLVSE